MPGPGGGGALRDLRHLLVAAVVTVLAGIAFVAFEVPSTEAAGVREVPAAAGDRVTVRIPETATDVHRVTLTFGTRRTSVILDGAAPAATVTLPFLQEEARLRVQVTPVVPIQVIRNGQAPHVPPSRAQTWNPTGMLTVLPPPQPRDPTTGLARAAIDERDTFGIRTFGVPLRATPSVRGGQVATAFHGDVYDAACWTIGDLVSNGVYFNRPGAYESRVWFEVLTWPGGRAYVPDTRFSRSDAAGRLDLPRCPAGDR